MKLFTRFCTCIVFFVAMPIAARAQEVTVASLIKIIADPDKRSGTKNAAIVGLTKFKGQAEPAIPVLKRVIAESNDGCVNSAIE